MADPSAQVHADADRSVVIPWAVPSHGPAAHLQRHLPLRSTGWESPKA
ncbi:MAG: hypothetical protein ACSLFP_05150 [Acidimicrobiales bacterium]